MALGSSNSAEAGSTTRLVAQGKRKTILEAWDKRRVVEFGDEAGSWEVLYCSAGLSIFFSFVFFFYFLFLFSPPPHFIFELKLYCAYNIDPKMMTPLYAPQGGQMRRVRCEKKELKDVHVPLSFRVELHPTSKSQPHVKSTTTTKKKSVEEEEALEDLNRKIGELFEWIGMACLGSQRFSFLFFSLYIYSDYH